MSAVAEIAAALSGKPNGSGWVAHCPCHLDDNPSLSINEGGDGKVLLHCHAGCGQEDLIAYIRGRGFDLSGRRRKPARPPQPVAYYDYQDEHGEPRYRVVRMSDKKFPQERYDAEKRAWISGAGCMDGVERLPFRLPELLAEPDKPLWITEGEKDALRLAEGGLSASCNSGGAGKWQPEITRWFRNRDVRIVGDNDESGRDHVAMVAKSLRGIARCVRVVDLVADMPNLPPKGDVSNWLDAGRTVRELRRLAHSTAPWEPTAADLPASEEAASDDADARPPEYSDDALALRFSTAHGEDARHVALWGKWLLWSGSSWQFDDTMRAFDLARMICRAASAEVKDPKRVKLASAIASARTVAAIVNLSRADRRHAVATDQFDPDPMIFNAKRMP